MAEALADVLARARRDADAYREADGYAGPWVFYPGYAASRQPTWTYQALHHALRRAESTAGVAHQARRAVHSVRRSAAGDTACRSRWAAPSRVPCWPPCTRTRRQTATEPQLASPTPKRPLGRACPRPS